MKIRDYAKSIGFEVVGKLTYMGKRGLAHRWYMDESENNYFINICIEDIKIIAKGEVFNEANQEKTCLRRRP